MSNDFMLAMAKFMPEDMLIEQLEQALSNYKNKKSEEAKHGLQVALMLITTRLFTEDKTVEELSKDINRQTEARDLYNRITGDTEEEEK